MNAFDVALVALVALSTLFAFAAGIVRELIALFTWIVAIVAAIELSDPAAALLSWLHVSAATRHVLAFVIVLLAVLIAGALVARALSGVIRAIGLGFVDRLLGAVFGAARGVVVLVVFALVAGVTTLPRHDWWQNAMLAPLLGEAALALRPYLPHAWAERLDFTRGGRALSARLDAPIAAGPPGECRLCVES